METNLRLDETKRMKKKRIGAFYTPNDMCHIISKWAIESSKDFVLEPSFGHCGFLRAVHEQLMRVGAIDPFKQIFGADIDLGAFEHLFDLFPSSKIGGNFVLEDFISFDSAEKWKLQFDVSIGNPPYLSYQSIPKEKRLLYLKICKADGIDLDKRSNIWAYFLIHAISLLKVGGRLAWILPCSILQANYSARIRDYISNTFAKSVYIRMNQKLFISEGTNEQVVVLLAEQKGNFLHQNDSVFSSATSVSNLEKIIIDWSLGKQVGRTNNAQESYFHLSKTEKQAYHSLAVVQECKRFGDIIDTNIGIVTGNSTYFVLTKKQVNSNNLNSSVLSPILAKVKTIRGINYTKSDHEENLSQGARSLLFHADKDADKDVYVKTYLEKYPKNDLMKNSTFKKRESWCAPNDFRIPDVFISVLNSYGPRVIENKAKINCTNSIYRGYYRTNYSPYIRMQIAISMLSSFSQLSAELVGRRYGGGGLKHEPSDIENISILLPIMLDKNRIRIIFHDINLFLREGNIQSAYDLADAYLSENILVYADSLKIVKQALFRIRKLRRNFHLLMRPK
jgi:adenine-specific DNA-methyltransferase